MVLHTTGGAHHNLHTLSEGLQLDTHGLAAVDSRHAGIGTSGKGADLLAHLQGQLTGGSQHQSLDRIRRLPDGLHQGEPKGGSLAGTSAGLCNDVGVSFQQTGNG